MHANKNVAAVCRKRAFAPQLRASEVLIQASVFDRYRPILLKNSA